MKNNTDVLDVSFYSKDLSDDLSDQITIREFFYALMWTLWEEGESFSGKHPFGNSGWDADLIICLIEKGYVTGKIDEDGYLEKYNQKEVDKFVRENILKVLCGIKGETK